MGTKKIEAVETENKPKKRGRPKVSEGGVSTPKLSLEKEKKKPLKAIYDEDGEILSLDEIKANLLKKAKAAGSIDQSTGLTALDVNDLLLGDLTLFAHNIQNLTANHAVRTGTLRKNANGGSHIRRIF